MPDSAPEPFEREADEREPLERGRVAHEPRIENGGRHDPDAAPTELPLELLDELASNLLWRIGKVSDDGPVTVRVGLASSADHFQTLPRLRSASDGEVEAAINESTLKVEWVGARPKGADK